MPYKHDENETKKIVKRIIIGVVSLIVFITLLCSFTTIRSGEIGVKSRFGKITGQTTAEGIVFKIQISASTKELATSPSNFKGLSPISVESTGSLFKYFYASEKNYDVAKQKLEEAKKKGYSSAFIVAYKDGIKINVTDAIK